MQPAQRDHEPLVVKEIKEVEMQTIRVGERVLFDQGVKEGEVPLIVDAHVMFVFALAAESVHAHRGNDLREPEA